MPAPASRNGGFTLVELAMVILIVALLLGTILGPLSVQIRAREVRDAQRAMADVRAALIGFAQSQGRLPCPDTDLDGQENPAGGGVCTADGGFLPYADLGVGPTDRWGRLYGYRLAPAFARTAVPGTVCTVADTFLGLCDTGDVAVNTRSPAKAVNAVAPGAAALVVSHGPNGTCGTLPDGTQVAPDTGACPAVDVAEPDEFENVDGDRDFVSRLPTDEREAANCSDTNPALVFCEFDDLVIWIPPSLLFGKMIEAGQLP
jgi:prepilin-type N-terminal cleavage/methylation domain-containing protein